MLSWTDRTAKHASSGKELRAGSGRVDPGVVGADVIQINDQEAIMGRKAAGDSKDDVLTTSCLP